MSGPDEKHMLHNRVLWTPVHPNVSSDITRHQSYLNGILWIPLICHIWQHPVVILCLFQILIVAQSLSIKKKQLVNWFRHHCIHCGQRLLCNSLALQWSTCSWVFQASTDRQRTWQDRHCRRELNEAKWINGAITESLAWKWWWHVTSCLCDSRHKILQGSLKVVTSHNSIGRSFWFKTSLQTWLISMFWDLLLQSDREVSQYIRRGS